MAIRHSNNDIVYNQVDVDREGWCTLPLQSDSVASLQRLFGYVVLPVQPVPSTMYVDSLSLIRLHYNNRIPAVSGQKSLPEQHAAGNSVKRTPIKKLGNLKK